MSLVRGLLTLCLAFAPLSCGETASPAGPERLTESGAFAVGHQSFVLPKRVEGRELTVEVWYPASRGGDGDDLLAYEALDPARQAALGPLLDAAPGACVRRQTRAVAGAPGAAGSFPVVIASHCHECTRLQFGSIAERLASHGVAVFAVDHTDNTIYDELAGGEDQLGGEFLQVRGRDVSAVLDELEAGFELPGDASLELGQVGVLGHSFGAATVGRVLQEDDRFRAGMAIAAPLESPLLPGVSVSEVDEPVLFLLAREDNSISELGNQLIRMNHEALPGPSWLVEVEDAGHWSFSDIAGLTGAFSAGCGEGERQTAPGEPFTYVDNAAARDGVATLAALFFAGQLRGESEALELLEDEPLLEAGGLALTVSRRTP